MLRPLRSCPPSSPSAFGWDGALVEFRGFRGVDGSFQAFTLQLNRGGDPDGVALWFQRALALADGPEDFAPACLRCAPGPWVVLAGARVEAMAGYRYRVGLGRRSAGALRFECWRHYGPTIGWQRRCGPMPLHLFLAHRLAVPRLVQACGRAAKA